MVSKAGQGNQPGAVFLICSKRPNAFKTHFLLLHHLLHLLLLLLLSLLLLQLVLLLVNAALRPSSRRASPLPDCQTLIKGDHLCWVAMTKSGPKRGNQKVSKARLWASEHSKFQGSTALRCPTPEPETHMRSRHEECPAMKDTIRATGPKERKLRHRRQLRCDPPLPVDAAKVRGWKRYMHV